MNKPSKLMARRVAAARYKIEIPYLLSPDQTHKISHPQDIADSFSDFYSKLYNLKDDPQVASPTIEDINSFLSSVHLPSISQAQLADLNSSFTEDEILRVIKSLPNGKAPGHDGYPNEYLKSFHSVLLPYLCPTFNKAMAEGYVPTEMLQATIVTLPKPGKPADVPANFRPISLLNSDIKLYAKVLASHLL